MRIGNIILIIVSLLLLTYCKNSGENNSQPQDSTNISLKTDTEIDTTTLLKKGYSRDSVYFTVGLQYAEKLDTVNSIKFLKKAFNFNPKNYLYSYYLGYFYYALGKMDSAEKYLKKSIELKENNPKTHYYLGGTFLAKNKINRALKHFQRAFDLEPLNPEYNYSLCFIYELLGKRSKAKAHCLFAYYQDTLNVKAMHLLSNIYLDEDKPDSALIFVDKILEIDANQPLGRMDFAKYYHWKAHQLLAEEKFEEVPLWIAKAIHQYDLVLTKDSTYAEAYYNRGFAYVELKSYEDAMEDFKKAIKYNPQDYRAYFMLGSIYEYYKDYEEALKYYRKALELNPEFQEAEKAIKEVKKKM